MAAEFHLKFAVVDVARDLVRKSPFQPFRLKLHDGTIIEISNPDVISVTNAGVITFDDGHIVRVLNPALITSVDRASAHD
ncbi:MAG: hypothetical protein EXS37_12690 [Opitutus sp.]|nr:hypothetical protein [Opitutus sp.]